MLGDAVAEVLPRLRAQALSTMRDTCTIRQPGPDTTDPVTGVVTPTSTVVYPDPAWPANHPLKHGPCRVSTLDPREATPDAGGHEFTEQRYRVDVPVGSFRPRVGHIVHINTSTYDPFLAGREYRVDKLLHQTAATAYRLAVTEKDDPA